MDLATGAVLENTYEIIGEIGAGGGGVVFRARHLRLQTDVVVKKIKDEVRGKINSRQEADILKKLKHPCLPRVYDFIETEDGVFTVMDFIEGEDLDTAVKTHGRFSDKQVRKWAEQLGSALDYLHSQKPPIIHSDIKPANVMLTKEGDVCLIDFNISLAMGGTMESAVGISVGFSPPEQYRDPALYARVTHNYTIQKSLNMTGMPAKSRVLERAGRLERDGERTEVLSGPATGDDQTELLSGPAEGDERTELLSVPEAGDDRTELLAGPEAGEERTELLPVPAAGEESTEIRSSSLSGSLPRYTQFIGRGIDTRSDIYSLGMTLYYMLTGIMPPSDYEQRIAVPDTKVPVSEGFAVILEKMMELSPADRYQNGGEFLKAVRNCHKLDHRYIAMHRKQTAIQTASLLSLAAGILLVFCGMYRLRMEENSAYYELVSRAVETMAQADYDTAGGLLEEAKELSGRRIEAYEEEIHLLYLSGDYSDCASIGERYINTTPFLLENKEDEEQFANIYYLVGNAYFEQQDYANARKFLANALARYEENALYYRDYAITLARMGQLEEAGKILEAGADLGMGQDSLYMAQGEIARARGEYETAAGYLLQTIGTTADSQMQRRAVLLCADVYKTMGNMAVEKEVALLEQYRDQFDGSGKRVMTEKLAEAFARMAQADETGETECYEKSLSLFLSLCEDGYVTYRISENIAILYEYLQRFDEAEAMLLSMGESYPERYEVYKRLAFLEADRQQTMDNADRNYHKMQEYYDTAKEKYSGKEQDLEMDMLDVMMQEIIDGGWL